MSVLEYWYEIFPNGCSTFEQWLSEFGELVLVSDDTDTEIASRPIDEKSFEVIPRVFANAENLETLTRAFVLDSAAEGKKIGTLVIKEEAWGVYQNSEEGIITFSEGVKITKTEFNSQESSNVFNQQYTISPDGRSISLPAARYAQNMNQPFVLALDIYATVDNEADEILANVSGGAFKYYTGDDIKFGDILDSGVRLGMKDEKAVDVKNAGKRITLRENTKLILSETEDNALEDGRVTLALDNINAKFSAVPGKSLLASLNISENDTTVQISNVDFDNNKISFDISGVTDDYDKIVLAPDVSLSPALPEDVKTIEVEASGTALSDVTVKTTAFNIIDPFDIVFDNETFKVGLQNQIAGTVSISEKDKGMFEKGSIKFLITKSNRSQDGIQIEELGDITAEGELKISDLNVKTKENLEIKRQSKTASTISFKDIEITVDRTVPEGYYDLSFAVSSSTAVFEGKNVLSYITGAEKAYAGIEKAELLKTYGFFDAEYVAAAVDYITIGTPNIGNTKQSSWGNAVASFLIGDNKIVLKNGGFIDMKVPAYIQDPGYTMVPVRFAVKPFGVSEEDISFSNGVVTMSANDRIISLTNGSNIAVVNGNPIMMMTPVVIKEGRTYAPISDVANILGIKSAWDGETKTATFINE